MKILLGVFAFAGLWLLRRGKALDRDNRYFPVQSSSERAAGHPIVGAS